MKLSVERMPESQVKLDIAADEDEFAKAMDRAGRKVSRQLNVPGFRRGKAPRYIIEQLYGRGIFLDEAQSEVMEDLYKRALEQEALVPVGPPKVDVITPEPVGFRVVVSPTDICSICSRRASNKLLSPRTNTASVAGSWNGSSPSVTARSIVT